MRDYFANGERAHGEMPFVITGYLVTALTSQKDKAVFPISGFCAPFHKVHGVTCFSEASSFFTRHYCSFSKMNLPISFETVEVASDFWDNWFNDIENGGLIVDVSGYGLANVFENGFILNMQDIILVDEYIGQLSLNVDPWALRLLNQFVLPLHSCCSLAGIDYSIKGGVKGALHKPDTNTRKGEGQKTEDGGNKGAGGGALLGAQILLVMCGLIGGFGLFVHTFENSARISPNAGAFRILLSCLCVSGGGLFALIFFAGL